MNKVEFWLMNNPIRAAIQRYEAKRMRDMTNYKGGNVLEIGCGQGVGTKLIQKLFKPKKITAIDLDPKMVERAKERVKSKTIHFQQGDASKLTFKDDQFDAIFDFGILHHIPNWKDAIRELHRVLKPGGEVILEDLSIESFRLPIFGWLLYAILDHPYQQMYSRKEFYDFVEENDFKIEAKKQNIFWFNLVLRKI